MASSFKTIYSKYDAAQMSLCTHLRAIYLHSYGATHGLCFSTHKELTQDY